MYFFKLIRPINLLIIVITMYGARFFILRTNQTEPIVDNAWIFFLLVISTVFIAAGGNIINDYFDVKADRINKPERLIITKHIKRRWAIVSHWILNFAGFFIAVFISYYTDSLWFVLIHLASINLLWFYSMYFKRKPVVGNFIIALLTALIPVLVLIYFKTMNHKYPNYSEFHPETWEVKIDYTLIYLLSFFAFTQNFAREIVKDAQDVEGDKLIYVKSLPMKLGLTKSLYIVQFFLLLVPIGLLFHFLIGRSWYTFFSNDLLEFIPFFVSAILNLIVIAMIFTQKDKRLKTYDVLLKISMLTGVLSTFYLAFI
jgi:4-hydroxybenzoate polyprenyltransferase